MLSFVGFVGFDGAVADTVAILAHPVWENTHTIDARIAINA
jgi:hypothetical protein